MVWRRGASEEEYEAQKAMPWRAGAAAAGAAEAANVVVESWDDEIQQPTRADDAAAAARRMRARLGPTSLRALNLVLFGAAVLMAIAGALVAWMHVMNDPLADANAYYDAAARLNAGQALY